MERREIWGSLPIVPELCVAPPYELVCVLDHMALDAHGQTDAHLRARLPYAEASVARMERKQVAQMSGAKSGS